MHFPRAPSCSSTCCSACVDKSILSILDLLCSLGIILVVKVGRSVSLAAKTDSTHSPPGDLNSLWPTLNLTEQLLCGIGPLDGGTVGLCTFHSKKITQNIMVFYPKCSRRCSHCSAQDKWSETSSFVMPNEQWKAGGATVPPFCNSHVAEFWVCGGPWVGYRWALHFPLNFLIANLHII